MFFLSISEVVFIIFLLYFYFSIIWLSITNDEHYIFRIKINNLIKKLYFNKIKHNTIPLITLITTIEVLVTLPILIIIKFVNRNLDLRFMSGKYLLLPWFCITLIIFFLESIIYIRKRINIKKNEKVERIKKLEIKHADIKRTRKKHHK